MGRDRPLDEKRVRELVREMLGVEDVASFVGARSLLPQKVRPTDLDGARPGDGSPLVYSESSDLVTFQGSANTLHRPLGIYQSTSSASFQTIADGAWEYVDFDAALYSWMTSSEYVVSGGDNSTDNHIIVPQDGVYAVDGSCLFTSSATDHICISRIVVRSTGGVNRYPAMSGRYEDQIGNVLQCPVATSAVEMYAGETVLLQALVSGLALALRSNVADSIPSGNYLQIVYLGPIPE